MKPISKPGRMDVLRQAKSGGTVAALDEAQKLLDAADTRVATDLRERCFELADAMFASIQMQTSVPKYKAIGVDRGATLDTIDVPLTNRLWLKERFDVLRALSVEEERLAGIREIVEWTNPGPGGFYDDLGKLDQQPHLVVGPGVEKDPAFLASSHTGFAGFGPMRASWKDHAESTCPRETTPPLRTRSRCTATSGIGGGRLRASTRTPGGRRGSTRCGTPTTT